MKPASMTALQMVLFKAGELTIRAGADGYAPAVRLGDLPVPQLGFSGSGVLGGEIWYSGFLWRPRAQDPTHLRGRDLKSAMDDERRAEQEDGKICGSTGSCQSIKPRSLRT